MTPKALTPITRQTTAVAPTQAELDDIRETMGDAVRANTQRAYGGGWADFADFCAGIGTRPEAADDTTVVRYLQSLKARGLKLATIQARRAAVSARFGGRQNRDNPALRPAVAKIMQGIANQLAKRGKAKPEQARAVMLDELRSMCAALPDTLAGKRDRAILTVGFFCAMRRSEIAGLDVRDVVFSADTVQVTITASKTSNVTESDIVTIPVLLHDAAVCPSAALRAWLSAAGIDTGAMFVRVDRWGHAGRARLADKHVDTVVKRAARAARLGRSDYARISGHSLRAGLATSLAASGATSWEIRQITRHKSDVMLNRYIRAGGAQTVKTIGRIVQRRADAVAPQMA
jgi:integrase